MGVPQQTNPTLLSSSQSPKPTFKVRWGPCLVSSQTHLQHSEWGIETCLVVSPKLLIYATTGKFGQIANLQRVTCARQRFSISAKLRVHISKSLFRFVKDLHVSHDGSRKAIRGEKGFLEVLLLFSFLLELSDEHVHLPNQSDVNWLLIQMMLVTNMIYLINLAQWNF